MVPWEVGGEGVGVKHGWKDTAPTAIVPSGAHTQTPCTATHIPSPPPPLHLQSKRNIPPAKSGAALWF